MSITEKYEASLDAKSRELMGYIRNQLSLISISSPEPAAKQPSGGQNSMLPIGIAAAGGIVLVAGLALGKGAVSAIGGLVLVSGAYMKMKSPGSNQVGKGEQEIKYYAVTKKVYDALYKIQQHVFDDWNSTLTDNQSKLKAEIGTLSLEEEKKNAAIQSILTSSVFDLPMSKISKSLREIERTKNIDGYKQYLATFENLCKEAIDAAVAEQKKTYSALGGIL